MNTDQLLSEHSRSLRLIEKSMCCLITAINNIGITAEGVDSYTTTTTVTANAGLYDMIVISALATALTIANPTGIPVDGQSLIYRIKDDGTSRAITFDTKFIAYGDALPVATTAGKTMYIGCIYNAAEDTWAVFPVNIEQ